MITTLMKIQRKIHHVIVLPWQSTYMPYAYALKHCSVHGNSNKQLRNLYLTSCHREIHVTTHVYNIYIYVYVYVYVYIYIYICVCVCVCLCVCVMYVWMYVCMYHNPCFNLFIVHNSFYNSIIHLIIKEAKWTKTRFFVFRHAAFYKKQKKRKENKKIKIKN